MIKLIKEFVDPNLEAPDSFYKAKRMVSKLGFFFIRIDICQNGYTLYCKKDDKLKSCRFF